MSEFVLVLTTVPDDPHADELAKTLIDERLAACVNLHHPISSTFRWKGVVDRESERQMVIKTTRDRLTAVEGRIRQLHPYALPEFLILPVEGGSAKYLQWVRDETAELRDQA